MSSTVLFPRKINLNLFGYHTRVLTSFSWKWSLKWKNFIVYFWHIFACRIIYHWMFTHTQSLISQIQVSVFENFSTPIFTDMKHRTKIFYSTISIYFYIVNYLVIDLTMLLGLPSIDYSSISGTLYTNVNAMESV